MGNAEPIGDGAHVVRPGGVCVMDTWVDQVTMEGAVNYIASLMSEGRFSYSVTPNVDHLVKLRHDPEFREAYGAADLAVADGVPLVWASRLLGSPLPERVNGTDLMVRLAAMAAINDYSVYLLGGAPGTAEAAARLLQDRYDGLRIAGHSCPPVGFDQESETNDLLVESVAASGADILFVALGAPKQEKWIHFYGERTGVRHAIGIGGSFSLITGQIRRAPRWAQRAGLEWAWRFAHEPSRLWRRYLIDDLPFLRYLAKLVVQSRFRR